MRNERAPRLGPGADPSGTRGRTTRPAPPGAASMCGVSGLDAPEHEAGAARRYDRPMTADNGPDLSSFPEILTTAMAAELLHVHPEYLRRMVREGRVPAHRFPGGREMRFLREELVEWMRDQPGVDRSPAASSRKGAD